MTLITKGLYVTPDSISDIQQNNGLPLCLVTRFINDHAKCQYAECHYVVFHYAESHGTNTGPIIQSYVFCRKGLS